MNITKTHVTTYSMELSDTEYGQVINLLCWAELQLVEATTLRAVSPNLQSELKVCRELLARLENER